jgi:hypothetical protein
VRIFGFLSICAAAAATLALVHSYLNFSDLLAILFFLLFVFALSLGFPARIGPLNKEYADLVYYCLAILAVFVIFAGKEGERKRLDLASRIEDAAAKREETKKKIAAATEELRNFDYVASNRVMLLEWANARVDAALKDAEDVRAFDCRCAIELSLPADVRGAGECSFELPFGETGRASGGHPGQMSDDFGIAAMAAGDRCDKENATLKAIDSDRSQSPRRLETIFRLAASLPKSGAFENGDIRIEYAKVLSWLQLSDADRTAARAQLTAREKQIETEAATIEAELKSLQMEHAESLTKSKRGLGLVASLLYEELWPYILISALGLKIARVRYV